jgi:hypothetical protein
MASVGLGPVFDAMASLPIFSIRAGYANRPLRSKRPQASRSKKANRNHISRRTRRKHRRSK